MSQTSTQKAPRKKSLLMQKNISDKKNKLSNLRESFEKKTVQDNLESPAIVQEKIANISEGMTDANSYQRKLVNADSEMASVSGQTL